MNDQGHTSVIVANVLVIVRAIAVSQHSSVGFNATNAFATAALVTSGSAMLPNTIRFAIVTSAPQQSFARAYSRFALARLIAGTPQHLARIWIPMISDSVLQSRC